MPQKRMAARGQPSKLAKGPGLKKSTQATNDKTKDLAKKAKIPSSFAKVRTPATKIKVDGKTALKSAAKVQTAKAAVEKAASVKPGKENRPQVIEKAKAALKTATPTGVKKAVKAEAPVVEAQTPAPNKSPVKEGKAPKEKRGRKISIDINPNEAASALSGKWATLFKKAEQIEAKPYNMKAVFEEKTAITHKLLGWGYILANRNDRLEVLFKDGIKYLISNYKP